MNHAKALFVVLIGLLLAGAAPAVGEDLSGEGALKALTNDVMKQISAGKLDEGFSQLKQHWTLPVNEIDQLLAQTKTQMNLVSSRFGPSLGYELIGEKTVGTSFQQLVYLQKLSNPAIAWNFRFYKPKDSWIVNSVAFSDNIDRLIEAQNRSSEP